MRMVEPELPQSNSVPGGVNTPAQPSTSTVSPERVTFAPNCCMQARLLAQSAPVEKL